MTAKIKYNPENHHRISIRLKGCDYSQAGLYFVTICVQDHKCLFGCIENGEMVLNDAGVMIAKWPNDKLNGGSGNMVMESAAEYNHEIWMV